MDDDDRPAATASAPLVLSHPRPLWSEQAPQDWWQAVVDSLDALASQAPAAMAAVRGIGLSGQMLGVTLLDAADTPIRPALLWNDGRASAECADLHRCVADFADIVGCRAMPGFSAPKLLWLTRHEPDAMTRARRILLTKDYIRLRADRRGRQRPRRRLGDAADGYRPRRLARRHPGGLRHRSRAAAAACRKCRDFRHAARRTGARAGICRPARRWRAAAATTCARASAWARCRPVPPTSAWERRASTSSPTIASCRPTAAACTPIATPCRASSPSMPSP